MGGEGADPDDAEYGDGLAGLEQAVRDGARRLMSTPEVRDLSESIRAGAMKVRLVPRFVYEQ